MIAMDWSYWRIRSYDNYSSIDGQLCKTCEKVTTIKVTYEKAGKDRLNLIYEDDA